MSTYVDAVSAAKAWANGHTTGLVGAGNPIQMGAHLHHPRGGNPGVYVLIDELPARHSDDSPENPDMLAVLSWQVYGGTREAATKGAVALAQALTDLAGMPATVGDVILWVADDIQGPSWVPDGDTPRLILQATVRMRPA